MPIRNHLAKRKPANAIVDTRTQLLQGALAEFNESGFYATDTNRIARRAGFAPQTFYRWFKDKADVFIACYQSWENTEREMIDALLARKASNSRLVDAVVDHHREYLVFRRSLRQLSLEHQEIRRARAASRRRQIDQLQIWHNQYRKSPAPSDATLASTLLQMERLADALAEHEFEDMNIDPASGRTALADLLSFLRADQ